MARILIRAGKSPFDVVSPIETIEKNLIANNSGNLLFAQSVYKALFTPYNTIDVNRYIVDPKKADEISDRYDVFVLPLANAFRPSFEKMLRRHTALIRKLKIPCVVVGVGAQTDLEHSQLSGSPIDDAVKDFASAILDKSSVIGVRGDYTKRYLNKLGFSDVETIGCPSMYLNGSNLSVQKKPLGLSRSSKIALNITPRKGATLGSFFKTAFSEYNDTVYVPQDMEDAHLLMSGIPIPNIKPEDGLPSTLDDAMMQPGKAVMFTDVKPWLEFMKHRDFSVGTRIHGNVFAILSGTPGFVIAHDSRTLELAEYYQIPHRRGNEITAKTSVAELYDEADYEPMLAGHEARFVRFQNFLEKNGLAHAYKDKSHSESSDKRMEQMKYLEPIYALLKVPEKPCVAKASLKINTPMTDPKAAAIQAVRDFVAANFTEARQRALARLEWVEKNRDGLEAPVPKVYCYWAQGFENAPPVVKACRREAMKRHDEDQIHFLDDSNIRYFVDIPDEIVDGVFSNKTAFSDYLRYELLSRYGGVWQDATCFSTRTSFSAFQLNTDQRSYGAFGKTGRGIYSNWFITSSHKSYVSMLMREMIRNYFIEKKKPDHYFSTHQIFKECYIKDEKFRNSIIDLGSFGFEPRAMNRAMLRVVPNASYNNMKQKSLVHKLSWKHNISDINSKMLISQIVRGDRI